MPARPMSDSPTRAAETRYELICPRCLDPFMAPNSAVVGSPCPKCAPLFVFASPLPAPAGAGTPAAEYERIGRTGDASAIHGQLAAMLTDLSDPERDSATQKGQRRGVHAMFSALADRLSEAAAALRESESARRAAAEHFNPVRLQQLANWLRHVADRMSFRSDEKWQAQMRREADYVESLAASRASRTSREERDG